jgi:hypothetical protein
MRKPMPIGVFDHAVDRCDRSRRRVRIGRLRAK